MQKQGSKNLISNHLKTTNNNHKYLKLIVISPPVYRRVFTALTFQASNNSNGRQPTKRCYQMLKVYPKKSYDDRWYFSKKDCEDRIIYCNPFCEKKGGFCPYFAFQYGKHRRISRTFLLKFSDPIGDAAYLRENLDTMP